jgi:hypothetical protein
VRPKSDRCRSRPWGCRSPTKLPRRGSLRGIAYAILLRKPSPLELPLRGRPALHTLPQRREAASKNSSQGSHFAVSPLSLRLTTVQSPRGFVIAVIRLLTHSDILFAPLEHSTISRRLAFALLRRSIRRGHLCYRVADATQNPWNEGSRMDLCNLRNLCEIFSKTKPFP